uniref:ER degradation-enhancing alpha-mannosidase-like protein 3 isoform X1 n=1 Tax=Vespula vulgaris TaxID=7454 RepID=UPI00223B2CFB|nr:ER degradation-enhancing alpha-mannosidase-like protein 3 isoform X1 [Vespula vulgaris]
MARDSLLFGLLMFGCSINAVMATSDDDQLDYMSKEEREALKDEARDMFYHAYNAYMENAYPADELMPLSCKGRYRGSEPNRGDIDSTLGNFSLTLVDTLDTLVVLGDLEEFENAVKLVARDVSFDTDVIVSLFETNIRMLGGLLSGHILAEYLQQRADIMPWYRGQLLDLAKDLGYRFLPAFNTSTGIPYGRINLKYGMKGVPTEVSRETCTACAGSMILEMAALSRLTGESIFEEKAQKAMDVLWKMRHRGTDLMGSVLNVNSGDWVRRDSGVGAGIDSYYEYCLKAYILLGDEKYLGRFNKHYQAIMKYVSQGPMLLDVHMHRPNTNSKNFMDALLAFWPGLQVLKGDIKPAVETHEMLYQVMQRHNFIPEAFTTDFQVHWGHHPLRPEFLESTYFLYRATGDHYYLGVGRKVLKSLQTYARVSCGYAAVSDVRTNKHADTMDSFVLSETLKYLYLLFVEPSDLVLDLDEFIFTTEGHLLPLTLASIRTNVSFDFERDSVQVDEFDRTCPNSLHLFPASVRQPLRNMVEDVCPRRPIKRRLSASQFQANNLEHLKMLSEMGITTLTLADGRVQLLHTFSNAKTPQDSEEGLLFMQEMVELSITQSQQTETKPQAVTFIKPKTYPPQKVTLLAGPAHFGPELHSFNKVTGKVVFTYPLAACTDLLNTDKLINKIVIMNRGDCMFMEKARRIQKAGAIAGIVLDNVAGTSAATSPIFAMSGDEKEVDDVTIPVVFLFNVEAVELIKSISASGGELTVTIGNFFSKDEVQLKAPTDLSMFEQLKGSLKSLFTQQITSQSTVNNDLHEDIISNSENEQQDTIEFHHFSAQIIKDSLGGEIRITVKPNVPLIHIVNSETTTSLEKQWQQLKEVFLNQIYIGSDQRTGLYIRTFLLTSYYNWIMTEQGVDKNVFNAASLKQKVLWFLKELTEVEPNPSIGQLMDSNKQKILKQHLLTKMDLTVLYLKEISTKLKEIRSTMPSLTPFIKISRFDIRQINEYIVLRHLLKEIFDGDDKIIKQHLDLLDHVGKIVKNIYQEILMDDWQKNVEKFDGNKDPEFLKLQRAYVALIQEVDFTNDNNESNPEINTKDLFKLLDENKDYDKKYESFENFIWTEIEKVNKNTEQNTLQEYEDESNISNYIEIKNNENEIITTESDKMSIQSDVLKQSKNESMKNKIENIEEKELVSLDITQQNNVDTIDKTAQNKESSTETSYKKASFNDGNLLFPISKGTMKSYVTESVSQDEIQKILQEIHEGIGNKIKNSNNKNKLTNKQNTKKKSNNNVISTDLLEEFKKPIWASDEEKSKFFTEFHQKARLSNTKYNLKEESDLKYKEDHTINFKSRKNDNNKYKIKHIDDEL